MASQQGTTRGKHPPSLGERDRWRPPTPVLRVTPTLSIPLSEPRLALHRQRRTRGPARQPGQHPGRGALRRGRLAFTRTAPAGPACWTAWARSCAPSPPTSAPKPQPGARPRTPGRPPRRRAADRAAAASHPAQCRVSASGGWRPSAVNQLRAQGSGAAPSPRTGSASRGRRSEGLRPQPPPLHAAEGVPEQGVGAAVSEQVLVRAVLHHPAAIDDHDALGGARRRQSVGHEQRGPSPGQHPHGLLHPGLAGEVELGGGLVQQQDDRIHQVWRGRGR